MTHLVTAYDQRSGKAHQVKASIVGHPGIAPHLALTPPTPPKRGKAERLEPPVTEAVSTAPDAPATGEEE